MSTQSTRAGPRRPKLLRKLGSHVPDDGLIPVTGGAEGETLHPLEVAPHPDRPIRGLFPDDAVAADLERLTGLQQDDGGWVVDFQSASPRVALDWRGYATVRALDVLRRNDALKIESRVHP